MRYFLQALSWLALALSIVPAILYFARLMPLDRMKLVLLIAMIVWFVATPFWMGRKAV
jgi:hypothetical protein